MQKKDLNLDGVDIKKRGPEDGWTCSFAVRTFPNG